MAHPLIGLHAFLGEIGLAAFLWIFVEMRNPTPHRIKRAKIAAVLGTIFLFLSWFVGGYYYTAFYGADVKPLIKEGPQPWAHGIIMEAKEHIFLFIPFLAFTTFVLIRNYSHKIERSKKIRKSVLWLSALILILGLLMALMGYLISAGARSALEAGI